MIRSSFQVPAQQFPIFPPARSYRPYLVLFIHHSAVHIILTKSRRSLVLRSHRSLLCIAVCTARKSTNSLDIGICLRPAQIAGTRTACAYTSRHGWVRVSGAKEGVQRDLPISLIASRVGLLVASALGPCGGGYAPSACGHCRTAYCTHTCAAASNVLLQPATGGGCWSKQPATCG